jgi:hypothetical protein
MGQRQTELEIAIETTIAAIATKIGHAQDLVFWFKYLSTGLTLFAQRFKQSLNY